METKKITVKHYLNVRAKVKMHGRESFFPLYVQIIVSGKKAQIKSRINEHLRIYRSDIDRLTSHDKEVNELLMEGYVSEELLRTIHRQKTFPIYHLLNDEVQVITRIIRFNKPFDNEQFTLSNFSWEYQKHTMEITSIFDQNIKQWYLAELKGLFLKAIDQEENKDIFKVTNYFIHFINWDNSFSNFYENTFEIMPSELKALENLFSNELRTTIKAFMAYHTKVNILKRFFEKREQGRISTLSYLDWEIDIKDFLMKEFEKIFGEQRALEYTISLDNILTREISRTS
ncbi:MAG: hypothetical protein U0T82_08485 [Bacteroidales bacterium]